MKLFYVIDSLGAGGAERSLTELLPFYQEAGIKPTLICLRRRREGVEADVRLLGCDVRYLPGGGLRRWIPAFRRLLRDERPDIVHTTLYESHVVGRLGAAGTGIPVVSSLVNTPYDRVRARDPHLNHLGFRVVQAVDGWTARRFTTRFHAITHAVRDAYVVTLRLPAERIEVIERGRSLERLGAPGEERRREVRERLGIGSGIPVLVNVGRQEFQKGQIFLLEALATIRRTQPDVLLLIAGRNGNATTELKAAVDRYGVGDHVRFLGHRTDVADLVAASDLFVFPSLFEGLGGALIEAMALGLPVVASDIPALREVVEPGKSGLLAEAGSAAALARAVDELLGDPARMAEFGARGRELFHERFRIERSAERMVGFYRSVVASGPRGTVAVAASVS